MLPVVICRHYDVEWLDARKCYCAQCGRQGEWTDEGYAIWIRADRPQAAARPIRAKVA